MDKINGSKVPQYPEVVGSNNADNKDKIYEVERLVNTLAAIIEKYAGQLDAAQAQRKAG